MHLFRARATEKLIKIPVVNQHGRSNNCNAATLSMRRKKNCPYLKINSLFLYFVVFLFDGLLFSLFFLLFFGHSFNRSNANLIIWYARDFRTTTMKLARNICPQITWIKIKNEWCIKWICIICAFSMPSFCDSRIFRCFNVCTRDQLSGHAPDFLVHLNQSISFK